MQVTVAGWPTGRVTEAGEQSKATSLSAGGVPGSVGVGVPSRGLVDGTGTVVEDVAGTVDGGDVSVIEVVDAGPVALVARDVALVVAVASGADVDVTMSDAPAGSEVPSVTTSWKVTWSG